MTSTDRNDQLEQDVDAVITMCGGSMRKAIRTLVIINGVLIEDNARLEAATSKGFAREVKREAG
jgi:hypothetical protein